MADAEIRFYFDPVCPFCWMTSKWVRLVQAQRGFTVDWRFISLRLLNAHVDYDAEFPPEYEAGHTAGLRLLRVAARTREEHGGDAVARLYERLGARIFESEPLEESADHDVRGTCGFVTTVLEDCGLPAELADALEDTSWDPGIQAETDEALAAAGKDVGTPIIHFGPPDGVAFFGPVISRLPTPEQAVELWDHVVGLASFRRLRRAQAQPARASPAAVLRCPRRRGRTPGGLARREPTPEALSPATGSRMSCTVVGSG